MVEQPKGVISRPIFVSNAIITGDLEIRYGEFQADVTFTGCLFRGKVDFSFCIFCKAAAFSGSQFEKDLSMRGICARADLEWTGTEFNGDLDCSGMAVKYNLRAEGARFQKCSLQAASIGGQAVFKESTTAPAHFRKEASFDLMEVSGGLFLSEARFDGYVNFMDATIKHCAEFDSAVFNGKTQMDGLVIDGDAHFERAQFTVNSDDERADRIRFPGIRVAGQGIFDRAQFGGDVRFDQACFMSEAFFESTQFKGSTRFDGASFSGLTRFTRNKGDDTGTDGGPTRFMSGVNFAGAKASADVHFEGAQFRGDTSFRDANFKVVYFGDSVRKNSPRGETPQFDGGAKLDLRGFSYDRIFLAWGEALDLLEPYDVQPYRQMERAFRTIGKDRDADKVYLKQRRRALWYDCQHPTRWLLAAGGLLYWVLARFGVRPLRLAVIPLVMVGYSAFVFSLPNAVKLKKDSDCVQHTLSWSEAFSVSLSYFLPVEVPVGACWQATNETFQPAPISAQIRFVLWATLLKLSGWILVPLGVAALGGFLRRDPSR